MPKLKVKILFRNSPCFSIESERPVAFEKVAGAAEMSKVAIKAKVRGFPLQVPFASHGSKVTVGS